MPRHKLLWCAVVLALTAFCQFAVYTMIEPSSQATVWLQNVINPNSKQVVVLWWTPFMTRERSKLCGEVQCLVTSNRSYMTHSSLKVMPQLNGGKKCPACGERVFHDKWRIGEKLAEDRWAHQQARQRELDEVTDFFL